MSHRCCFGRNITNCQLDPCSSSSESEDNTNGGRSVALVACCSSASDVDTAGGRSAALVASCCGIGLCGQPCVSGFPFYGLRATGLGEFPLKQFILSRGMFPWD